MSDEAQISPATCGGPKLCPTTSFYGLGYSQWESVPGVPFDGLQLWPNKTQELSVVRCHCSSQRAGWTTAVYVDMLASFFTHADGLLGSLQCPKLRGGSYAFPGVS